MRVLLISTYELGRQPFGLASPAAWLKASGYQVECVDMAVDRLGTPAVLAADLIALYLPMHTATRLAIPVIERIRRENPAAHLCACGLYAPLNEALLRQAGVRSIIGGEFERLLVELAGRVAAGTAEAPAESVTSLERLDFVKPDRAGLADLAGYARLRVGEERRTVGYTEASRGCKHLCRHCPVVPVYQGKFRVVPPEVVLADVGQQVAAGARHITFGDPDFLNGPGHARRIVEAFRRDFPGISYDVTVKVEHLLRHPEMLPVLKETGCLFVTSAVESVDDEVLVKLDKGHTRADFAVVAGMCRQVGLTLAPTFIPFTPWTTRAGYADLLRVVSDLGLVEHVGPVQLALRLLIPWGSRLLELEEVRAVCGEFDPAALVYRWRHPDPAVDTLAHQALLAVADEQRKGKSRAEIFGVLWELVNERPFEDTSLLPRAAIPYLDEPWYC